MKLSFIFIVVGIFGNEVVLLSGFAQTCSVGAVNNLSV